MRMAFLAAYLAAACVTVSAQWLKVPTPGIPRNPDGSPNLAAPAPKTADGKPDLSGLWDTEKNKPCNECSGQASQEYYNLGWSLPGGLPYQPWAKDLVKTRLADNGKDDPATH